MDGTLKSIFPLGLLWMLFYGVAAEQEPVNEGILTFIAGVLAGEDSSITQVAAQSFLQTQVMVTFMNIAYPENAYSWGLADTNDQTVILRATPPQPLAFRYYFSLSCNPFN